MSKKMRKNIDGLVFSTDPDFQLPDADEPVATIEPTAQQLRVWIDRKQRGGKEATVVKGFVGPEAQLKDLAKMLKTKIGVGGSAKDGDIIIQGDHRDKVVALLVQAGYHKTKKAGG